MKEHQFERREQHAQVKNMWQLKELCEREFGNYAELFLTSLKKISGYEAPRGMERPDPEEEREKMMAAMKGTEITSEIVDQVNTSISGVAKLNQTEIDFFKTRPGKESYVADCQKVVYALRGRRVALDGTGAVTIEKKN